MSYNKVILIGNFTRDPELRQTQTGTSVCSFSIAVNRSFTGNDGTQRDEAAFVECQSFGRTADNIAKYFAKGKSILVEGRLKQDTWNDKETGKQRSKLMVLLEKFEFVGGRDNDEASGRTRQTASRQTNALDEGEVPF